MVESKTKRETPPPAFPNLPKVTFMRPPHENVFANVVNHFLQMIEKNGSDFIKNYDPFATYAMVEGSGTLNKSDLEQARRQAWNCSRLYTRPGQVLHKEKKFYRTPLVDRIRICQIFHEALTRRTTSPNLPACAEKAADLEFTCYQGASGDLRFPAIKYIVMYQCLMGRLCRLLQRDDACAFLALKYGPEESEKMSQQWLDSEIESIMQRGKIQHDFCCEQMRLHPATCPMCGTWQCSDTTNKRNMTCWVCRCKF